MNFTRGFLYYLLIVCFFVGAAMMISAHASGESRPAGQIQQLDLQIDEIVVSLEDFELLTFSNGKLISRYPVSIGADTGPTPTGEFRVINKLKNPWYTPADKPAKAPGPDNPLGTRWLGINKPSYGIHGTRKPRTIGTAASEGCVRLHNEHVEILYEQVTPGTKVIIRENISDDLKRLSALFEPPEPAEESPT
ncbi:MAG: L,D-transpeptidase [bacterium]